MKFSKIIGLLIAFVQLVSAVALILGMHTMLGVFATALPSGEQEIDIQFTDPVIIPFTLTPTNNGYLEATMEVSVGMVIDGVKVVSDSATVTIPPGSIVPVELELFISQADAQEYFQEGVDLQWETDISVTTLYDLISFSNHMVIEGGSQQ
ncbi:hypothetical protein E4H04_01610 [Candidatus Bathyarchaeota archaeon]|nr:MAG: hypothetical protein E4H04_01610 [Candidatus Bathyarchaeota archaeon]